MGVDLLPRLLEAVTQLKTRLSFLRRRSDATATP